MEQEQENIVLLGSRFEILNKHIDLWNPKDLNSVQLKVAEAMQEYAELYHKSKLSKLS
jgi:hypothetical protein